MRTNKRFVFLTVALLTLAFHAHANAPEAGGVEEGGPRLEIRQYRFSRHNGGFDRLVLEFERKDANTSIQPKVAAQKSGTPREWSVQVDNALLLGAIPESLINDSYMKKSRYLGAISVNMDAPGTGFSVRAAMKGEGTRIQAMWLENPSRLVIDAYGGSNVAHRETSSMKTHSRPGLADLLCFPAVSKVGLTVIFQTQTRADEELQNIRVNTDGVNPTDGAPAPDAIVCYPKTSRVVAALSFEAKPKNSLISHDMPSMSEPSPIPEPAFIAPAPTPAPTAAAQPATVSDMDLDPGPLAMPPGLGQLPGMGSRAPAAAEAPKGMPAPAGSPLSLLPALNK